MPPPNPCPDPQLFEALRQGDLSAEEEEAIIAHLDACAPGWDRNLKQVFMLGAGGAARAVAHGLLARRIGRIVVVNRTFERAEALRQMFGAAVKPARWEELAAALKDHVKGSAGLITRFKHA